MNIVDLKSVLLQHCQKQVDNRYLKIKQTIADIEESLLEESKSSSGDKHETGRAMLQIDRENTGKQLVEIEKSLQLLKKIDLQATSDYARLGSLVYTDRFIYFISLSIGSVSIEKADYLCVALNSPVGMLLSGKKKDEEFVLNGITYKINKVK
ncbi:3-oxoacyl-ACP synthase [Aequorivita echinoideorum]|uniref:3-oxoacyl-ACP synthase n=1 Tax=Aequorivita echinoideorum TaxID=1549647 RepID=A0ABS5S1K8_9FLAO|nr:3-oxoacyl-ACP synthase [Aequorivita echinoideorum]MBT0607096.1 3-oxoacyl-ACP synthase [Aequorivita echinoideorum]